VGTILVEEVIESQTNDPTSIQILTDFCRAVDNKFLTLRQKLINEMFEGKACIDAYQSLYPGTYAELFDPLTSEQTPAIACTQIVDEVEALLANNDANQVNSLRYSYLVSQNSDLEVAEMRAFAGCVETEAEADPKTLCIETITEYGQFALFSNQMKADVCAKTVDKYKTQANEAIAQGHPPLNACSFVIV